MQQPVDHTLLLRTARGDDASARMLWAQVGPRLVALARAMLRSYGGEAAALDVVQTVLCRVVGADRRQVSKVNDAAAWLARGVRNECLNYRRSIDRRDAREATASAPTRHAALHPRPAPAPDTFADLSDALAALPDNLREVILLKHAAGLTFDQMAVSLNENRSTIATRYAKALKLLRDHSAPSTAPPPPASSRPGGRPHSEENTKREVHS